MQLRVLLLLIALGGEALANPVVGKIELPPPPPRPPIAVKGFLDRVDNPYKRVRDVDVGSYMVVVLDGEAKEGVVPKQLSWDLVGESFARPVAIVSVGAEVVIKNVSKTARTLVALEDPKLIPSGPINPTGPKSFRPTEPKLYTITDKDAPHLKGKLVVVASPFVGNVDVVNNVGKFEIDAPEGSYKVRVFYRDNWLDHAEATVNVPAKGKAEVTVKIPAGYPLKK
ncbi:MAG TPA: hypothetical protein VFQ53_16770 [Kofleriaceae bacterium]|nr:hypothetical protein [Kofleriaceae bacterium]